MHNLLVGMKRSSQTMTAQAAGQLDCWATRAGFARPAHLVAMEPDRLVQEAAILADRADVAEEVVRLRSHLDNFASRLAGGGPMGRALDFLCQEVHRELTTLGSKCRELGVADRLVDAKTATERIREQVQNLE